ncbi:hypothetical protein EYZ11_001401 [Aspergillus tanneri]|uniref:Cytochrome P450 n=1 Tax=Aspergillus tanneri TaxID=1220188 RepID=A0A4V3UQH6_9EURO|nr:hypothetical protein EYZ11_001401 [Aspergillus tanneri]
MAIEYLDGQILVRGIAVTLILVLVCQFFRDLADGFPYWNIPIIGRGRWELSNAKAKERYVSSAKELVEQGFSEGNTVFQMMFDHAPMFFGVKIPGFEPFDGGDDKYNLVREMVGKKLTYQVLGSLIFPLSRETAAVLNENLPKSNEWQPFILGLEVPYIVARLSSLVFLGENICRDKGWLNVSVNYATDGFHAARNLRLWPAILRPWVHWFMPSMQRLRKHIVVANEIIQREMHRRDMIRQGKVLENDHSRMHEDALDWLAEVANGRPLNMTRSQISMSLAAIHTSSNLVLNIMYDLIAYPEYIQPLRDEIKAVLEEDGVLKKSSLLKMKKLDSVMKETQRLNPVSLAFLNRIATEDITLSNGTHIPKGATLTVSAHTMQDEAVYPNANTYDGFRFYNMRQIPGNEHRFQLVSTSPEHLGFGHGLHACTGRFFAATEIKILLIHLLMKYDWKFADRTGRPKSFMYGMEIIGDQTVKLLYKARQPEVDLARLGEGILE